MANEIHRPITTTTAAAGHPFSEDQLRLLAVILDTVFAAEPGSAEGEQQDDTAARQLSSYDFSCLPDFKLDDLIQYILQSLRPKELEKFRLGLTFLSSSTITFALTGYYSSFLEIPKHERQRILAGWSSSFLPLKRSLYSAFVRLPISAIYSNSRVVQGLIGYPSDGDPRASSLPERRKPSYPYKFVQPPSVSANENLLKSSVPHLDVYETDVIVIGSGAGGSVVASLVAKAGYKTLVIEKGRWVPTEHITGSHHGFNDMLEGNGQISTVDGSLIMLLGTTFGGGTTINWSASLAPPYHVRREWAEEHGLKYFGTSSFGKDIEAVSTRMGVSAKDIVHSKANQLFLKGARKIGIHIDLIPQNTAGRAHDCGMCQRGCPFGEKQGAAQTWLKDCAESGGEFMQNGRVERILFSNESNPREIEIDPTKSSPNSRRKYAVGVIVCDSTTRKRSIIRARRAVVSSSGAINTPALLLRSGIHLNGAVGKGLHLHPVTAVTAWFDTQVKPWEGSIMTLISCEVENRLGTHYGAKLEVFASNPGFYSGLFVPWKSSESHKELMSRYAQSFTIVVLTRDRGSGRVSVEEGGNGDAIVDYTVDTFDAQSLLEGILIACQALAAAGASEIATTLPTLDHFKFETTAENHNQSRFENWLNGIKKAGVKPGYGVLGSAHQMSSCRMGSKPSKDSVVSEQGKVWEHENLWVADGSVLPTSTGVNPSISIMSVAHHIGNQIVDHLKDEDRSSSRKTLSKL
ncbi:hypothetical protein MJO29_005515 [Puccinia striiformis f. sp. tritici]|uniref:hypothetical protein n=1 Tax=Puccinia striiformis f. sp. tritici TaxID=168172 RepID=UPI002008B891|nr:hypothetical protein Pst134EA_009609 [Puccinia striiformis f. sp. tritici]KAH9469086.1 hypothetical protein Pst134EA_009609 [Puccinia striiformis f. sp. tritici]KAI7960447.1 hypothetical protein MJO29_005515 [Puccinia striiformis f. sp. tritici]